MRVESADYRLIFDASTAGFHEWKYSLFPLVFVVFGAMAFVLLRKGPTPQHRVFARVGAPIAVIAGIGFFLASLSEARASHRYLLRALSTGAYTVVEGPVSAFVGQGPGGHPAESWRVGDHKYLLSSFISGEGFREPGVVRGDDIVRIADVRGWIGRLEILRR